MNQKLSYLILYSVLATILFLPPVWAERILFIGDSHVPGPYGKELDALLQQAGHIVETYGCVGASPSWFMNGGNQCSQGSTFKSQVKDYALPTIEQLTIEFQPTVVIVSLGGNMFAQSGFTAEERKIQSNQLADAIISGGAQCIWVGPKYGPVATKEEAGEVYNDIKEGTAGKCQVIDSRELLQFNFCGDKQCCCNDKNSHLTAYGEAGINAGKKWAQGVFQQVSFAVASPLVTKGQPAAITGQTATSVQKVSKTVEGCSSQQRCKEIDQAWSEKVSVFIGGLGAYNVWNHLTRSWKKFDEVYYTFVKVTTPTVITPTLTGPAPFTGTLSPDLLMNERIQSDLQKGLYDQAFLARVQEIASAIATKHEYLMAIMRFESAGSFDPARRNSLTSATGLIQFLEGTANKLGTTTQALASMTQLQQLDYVEKYFLAFKPIMRSNNFGDLAMAVIWPKAIGKDDSTVLFSNNDPETQKAYEKNKNLDTNKDGFVTRGEYIQRVLAVST